MIFTEFRFERRRSHLITHLGLAPDTVLYTVEQRGLIYDSRFLVTALTPPTNHTVLHFILEGTQRFTSESEPCATPSLWLQSIDDIEGAAGHRAVGSRRDRAPFLGLIVHSILPMPRAAEVASSPPQRLRLDAQTLALAQAYTDAVRKRDKAAWEARSRALCDRLRELRWLPDAPLDDEHRLMLARMWDAMKLFYDRAYASPSMGELAEAVRLSIRQANRLVNNWTTLLGVPPEGFRRFTRRWRLKLAVLLLSSPDYTIAEVARIVGYGRGGGLTNAFAAEGLPSPSRVRELLLAPE